MKMKHFIILSLIIMFASKVMAHSSHYEGLKKIEMDVLRNNEIIGSTSYFFEFDEDLFVVKNYTNFKVELFGVTVFSILSETIEKYKDEKLVFFKSNTFQNDKEKYVNLNYDKDTNKFIIDGFKYCQERNAQLFGIYPTHNPYFMKPTNPYSNKTSHSYCSYDLKYIIGYCCGAIINHSAEFRTVDDKEDYERSIKYYLFCIWFIFLFFQ